MLCSDICNKIKRVAWCNRELFKKSIVVNAFLNSDIMMRKLSRVIQSNPFHPEEGTLSVLSCSFEKNDQHKISFAICMLVFLK